MANQQKSCPLTQTKEQKKVIELPAEDKKQIVPGEIRLASAALGRKGVIEGSPAGATGRYFAGIRYCYYQRKSLRFKFG